MPLPGQTQTTGKSHHYSTRVSIDTHHIIDATCKLTGWTTRQFLDQFVPAAHRAIGGPDPEIASLNTAIHNAAAENNAKQRNLALTRIVKARKDQRHAAKSPKAPKAKPRPKAHAPKRDKRRRRQAVARRRNAA